MTARSHGVDPRTPWNVTFIVLAGPPRGSVNVATVFPPAPPLAHLDDVTLVTSCEDRGVDAPTLPDGLVVVVKEECETCRMVAPLLRRLADTTVYTQDE